MHVLEFTDFYILIFPRDTQYIVFGELLYVCMFFYVCLQFRVYIVIEKKIQPSGSSNWLRNKC